MDKENMCLPKWVSLLLKVETDRSTSLVGIAMGSPLIITDDTCDVTTHMQRLLESGDANAQAVVSSEL
jgi:hypothetical protein